MTTQEIIIEINKLIIQSLDDLGALERIDKLTNLLRVNGDGYLARNVSRLLRSISIPILRKTTNSDDGLDA